MRTGILLQSFLSFRQCDIIYCFMRRKALLDCSWNFNKYVNYSVNTSELEQLRALHVAPEFV